MIFISIEHDKMHICEHGTMANKENLVGWLLVHCGVYTVY